MHEVSDGAAVRSGVTGGRLDNHLEGPETAEELDDLIGLVARKGLPCQDGLFLIHDAHGKGDMEKGP